MLNSFLSEQIYDKKIDNFISLSTEKKNAHESCELSFT